MEGDFDHDAHGQRGLFRQSFLRQLILDIEKFVYQHNEVSEKEAYLRFSYALQVRIIGSFEHWKAVDVFDKLLRNEVARLWVQIHAVCLNDCEHLGVAYKLAQELESRAVGKVLTDMEFKDTQIFRTGQRAHADA